MIEVLCAAMREAAAAMSSECCSDADERSDAARRAVDEFGIAVSGAAPSPLRCIAQETVSEGGGGEGGELRMLLLAAAAG